MGVSAMSIMDKPRRIDMGLSARSVTRQSVRDMDGQITEGRFEPLLFDANIQTDRELLENYFRKETAVIETVTDPVSFRKPIKFASLMCQTEPEIEELRTLDEPITDEMPLEQTSSPHDTLQPTPQVEVLYKLEVPLPPEPEEDLSDWAESSLY